MSKKLYLLLFFISLLILIPTLLFQRVPGYMDSEYYFLGGRELAQGSTNLPVIWNYLDNPEALPHPLFTYWMPLPSVISMISMLIFKSTEFLYGRILFWLLAAIISPITAFISFKLSGNRFIAVIAGLLAIFSGFYYKFFTIPESITPYILFGGVFFLIISKILEHSDKKIPWILYLCLGIVSGILHMARVDGVLFFFLGITIIIYKFLQNKIIEKNIISRIVIFLGIYILGYLLISGWWYYRNIGLFGSLFSPASSKAMWITSYDDTFIFPASALDFQYWFDNGLALKFSQIWSAFKTNIQTFVAVQTNILGLPLLILGLIKLKKKPIVVLASLIWLIFFILMTVLFSLSGERGGFLHSAASLQIILWCLISEGLFVFIQWGIKKRQWKLLRSEIMFGSALIVFAIIFSTLIYVRDVIGFNSDSYVWEAETYKYDEIEMYISSNSNSKHDVVMINNPVGYFYETNRWSLVLPNSGFQEFPELIEKFNIKFIVIDKNLPEKLSGSQEFERILKLRMVKQFNDGRIIYAVQ